MASRKKIGLVYGYSEHWIAGAYYVLNVIKALHHVADQDKPYITILHYDNKGLDLIKDLNYPYINYYVCKPFNANLFQRSVNKIWRTLTGRNLILDREIAGVIDYVFPVEDGFESVKNKIAWIPDFQDYYYPGNFSEKEIYYRNLNHRNISSKGYKIVFSSYDAKNDFMKFFPQSKNKLYVVNFASSVGEEFKKLDIDLLIRKFSIKRNYFMCPNQFWKHKNHITVLRAAKILRDQNLDLQIVFTGKESDQRNPDYFPGLKKYVADNNLQDIVKFLGFIDRNEQLQLMNNSVAVIQPSLFEGWSTVVEDCKSIGKFVILSDINVHKEQLTQNVRHFAKEDPADLAEAIKECLNGKIKFERINYEEDIKKFARHFINVFSD